MPSRPVGFALAVLVLVAEGCERAPSDVPPRPSAPAAAGEGGAASPALSTSVAAATLSPALATSSTQPPRPAATPVTAILRSAVAVEPAARLPLVPGTEVVIHPAATFEVELSARAADARLVLVDAREDLVPATGTRELAGGTRLTLAPTAPLVPGSRYALRLDGAADRDLHDEGGRAFAAVTLPLLAAGTPPPPEPKKPVRKRRHR